jgi:signal transduction histidine kinase
MLDTSRGTIGDISINRVKMDLVSRVRSVIETLPAEFDERDRLSIRIEAGEPVFIEADPSRIGQVVENLLTNAIKYGKGNPIDVSIQREGESAVLRVEDHGFGIAAENRERIFDRFERVVTNQSIGGLGLGLYITKKIVEAHGGKIAVRSELDEGSTFIVQL